MNSKILQYRALDSSKTLTSHSRNQIGNEYTHHNSSAIDKELLLHQKYHVEGFQFWVAWIYTDIQMINKNEQLDGESVEFKSSAIYAYLHITMVN